MCSTLIPQACCEVRCLYCPKVRHAHKCDKMNLLLQVCPSHATSVPLWRWHSSAKDDQPPFLLKIAAYDRRGVLHGEYGVLHTGQHTLALGCLTCVILIEAPKLGIIAVIDSMLQRNPARIKCMQAFSAEMRHLEIQPSMPAD